jgi:hypothetical protein
MRSRIKRLTVCLLLGLAPVTCLAGTQGESANVTIVQIQLNKNYPNVAFIRVTPAPTTHAECSINGFWHYTLPLSDAFGSKMYAALLTAYASQTLVDIGGMGDCNEMGQVESLMAVGVHT